MNQSETGNAFVRLLATNESTVISQGTAPAPGAKSNIETTMGLCFDDDPRRDNPSIKLRVPVKDPFGISSTKQFLAVPARVRIRSGT